MRKLIYKPEFNKYINRGWLRWNIPIPELDEDGKCHYTEDYTAYTKELEEIEKLLDRYSTHKVQAIEDYINRHPWIKLYLFWDDSAEREVRNIWQAIRLTQKDTSLQIQAFIKRTIDIIDQEIQKAGDIIQYLKSRYEFQFSKYRGVVRDYYEHDEEELILDFLY